jgi:hypothetical protein
VRENYVVCVEFIVEAEDVKEAIDSVADLISTKGKEHGKVTRIAKSWRP